MGYLQQHFEIKRCAKSGPGLEEVNLTEAAVIVIAGVLQIKDGKQLAFEDEFLRLQSRVLHDPGAVAFALHRSKKNPLTYFVLEKYTDDEALKYHTSTEHFKESFQKLEPLIAGNPEDGVGFYEEVTEKA
jgi:quinol monooxygenase YgiN